MSRMRTHKQLMREWLESPDWQKHLAALAAMDARESTGPLLSLLLLGGAMTARAAVALGVTVAALADQEPEAARNIVRRFMWHMNEESGNIGWGIPEAFAEVLARSPRMAKEFHSILLSYVVDTGHDDNFCDHGVLRRSCYWAVGRLAQARPELCEKVKPWLIKGLDDSDVSCRGVAAWALAQFPVHVGAQLEAAPALRRLVESAPNVGEAVCFVFDGQAMRECTVRQLAKEALQNA